VTRVWALFLHAFARICTHLQSTVCLDHGPVFREPRIIREIAGLGNPAGLRKPLNPNKAVRRCRGSFSDQAGRKPGFTVAA
jgi:hypothetical protein